MVILGPLSIFSTLFASGSSDADSGYLSTVSIAFKLLQNGNQTILATTEKSYKMAEIGFRVPFYFTSSAVVS